MKLDNVPLDDHIDIEALSVRTVIGVFPEERERRQEVLIFLRIHQDLSAAARTDSIRDALDYKEITKRVIQYVSDSRFQLLEALAEGVATLALEELGVRKLTVRVEKPGALRHARTVAVTITRAHHPGR